jgi:uncharacterized protein (TIGR02596 family)
VRSAHRKRTTPSARARISSLNSRAFTLVELLVVMGIMAILTAISIPSILGIVRSSSLTSGSNSLNNQLNFARQYAMANNCQVEFRFYQLPDPTTSSTTPSIYRAFQSLAVPNDGSADVALTKVTYLPTQIYILGSVGVSSLLQTVAGKTSPTYVLGTAAGTPLGTYAASSYNYYAFHFKPDGSTDLDPSSANVWYISLGNQHDALLSTNNLPANFVTLQVNPLNGRVRAFRPN